MSLEKLLDETSQDLIKLLKSLDRPEFNILINKFSQIDNNSFSDRILFINTFLTPHKNDLDNFINLFLKLYDTSIDTFKQTDIHQIKMYLRALITIAQLSV